MLSTLGHYKVQNGAKQVHFRAHFGEGLQICELMFYSLANDLSQMIQ